MNFGALDAAILIVLPVARLKTQKKRLPMFQIAWKNSTYKKQINLLEKELRKKEEGLFLEQMCIEATTKDEIEKLCGTDGISIAVSLIFKVRL